VGTTQNHAGTARDGISREFDEKEKIAVRTNRLEARAVPDVIENPDAPQALHEDKNQPPVSQGYLPLASRCGAILTLP